MNVETPAGPGLENIAGRRGSDLQSSVRALIAGEIYAHELPWPLWLVWSNGFEAGIAKVQPKLDRANNDADYWYSVANDPAGVRKRQAEMLKHFDVMQARKKAGAA